MRRFHIWAIALGCLVSVEVRAASVVEYLGVLQGAVMPSHSLSMNKQARDLAAAGKAFGSQQPTASSEKPSFQNHGPFKVVGSRLIKGEPSLVIESSDRERYLLRAHPWARFEQSSRDLFRLMGFESLTSWVVYGLSLDLSLFGEDQVALWLRSAPQGLRWSRLMRPNREGSKKYMTKWVMIEPIENLELYERISDLAGNDSIAATLFASFLQCENLSLDQDLTKVSERSVFLDLRYCLGHSPVSSSPNSFDDRWVRVIGRTKNLKFRGTYQDPAFLRLIKLNGPEQLGRLLKHLTRLNEENLVELFLSNGFPISVAKVYALRILARYESLARALNHEVQPWRQKLLSFSKPPYVEQGELVATEGDFQFDLTEEALQFFAADLAETLSDQVEATIQHLLATLPFVSVELFEVGPTHIAPGLIFRVKRTVLRNPNAQSSQDLFLIRDELDLGVTLGLGMNSRLGASTSLWANAGPGYLRKAVRVHFAPSLGESKESYWGIPWRLLFDLNYEDLNSGELFAVESGWLGMGIAGATFLSGFYLRPAAYLMGSYERATGVQVYRASNDRTIVMTADDRRWHLQSKGFWRVHNRYIRLPFFGYSQMHGRESNLIFDLDASRPEYIENRQEVLSGYQELIRGGKAEGLAAYIAPVESRANYNSWFRFLELYFYTNQIEAHSSEFNVDEDLYFVVEARTTNVGGILESNERCEFSGILAENNEGEPLDGLLEVDCHIGFDSITNESLVAFTEEMSAAFGWIQPKSWSDLSRGQSAEAMVRFSWSLDWSALQKLILPEQLAFDLPSRGVEFSSDFGAMPPMQPFGLPIGVNMHQSARENLEEVIRFLRRSPKDSAYLSKLIRVLPQTVHQRLSLESPLIPMENSDHFVFEAGEKPQTAVWQYYQQRKQLGYRFLTNVH